MARRAVPSTAAETRAQRASGRRPAVEVGSPTVRPGWAGDPKYLLGLQRLAGNRATVALLREDAPAAEDAGVPLVVTEEFVPDPGGPLPDTAPGEQAAGSSPSFLASSILSLWRAGPEWAELAFLGVSPGVRSCNGL